MKAVPLILFMGWQRYKKGANSATDWNSKIVLNDCNSIRKKWREEIESKIWHYFLTKTTKTSIFPIEIQMNHISVLEQFGKMLKSRIRWNKYRKNEVFVVSVINDAKFLTRFLDALFSKWNFKDWEHCYRDFLSSSDPSHYIFEINVGKSRIRHTTTLK